MDTTHQDPDPKDPSQPSEPELDLYTIPSYSSWFSWDEIHDTERVALKEFFDGSSISRTPKIYKEYRDFIINKFREDPSRQLTFTEIRKSLIGDVSILRKIFRFLENWGLINFGVPKPSSTGFNDEDGVRVEDGAPNGVRVVATPSALRPIAPPPTLAVTGGSPEPPVSGVRLPPLASYSDVFGDLKKLHCSNCRGSCGSEWYEHSKDNFIICGKCFKSGNYGENKSVDDFKLNDSCRDSTENGADWTEAETMLLLDSVLKHGDNWDLVAQTVQTKSKHDCVSKLIELPFGDILIDSAQGRITSSAASESTNSVKQVPLSSESAEKTEEQAVDQCFEQNGGTKNEKESPPKRQRITSASDVSSSLMKQIALITTMLGPTVKAAATEAAVTALSNETSCPKDIFYGNEDAAMFGPERSHHDEDSEMKETSALAEIPEASPKQSDIPLPLQIRATVATGLGVAAAHAKALAEQEERMMEQLVASIIEAQLKKLYSKLKHFEDLEEIMEKESAQLEELKDCSIAERIEVLKHSFNARMSKQRDHNSIKPQASSDF